MCRAGIYRLSVFYKVIIINEYNGAFVSLNLYNEFILIVYNRVTVIMFSIYEFLIKLIYKYK